VRFWIALTLLFGLVVFVFSGVGAPSPYLLAGVVAGGASAVGMPEPQRFPEPLRHLGLAVIGVAAGANIDADVVATVLDEPAAVLGGVGATLAVSMAAGQLLRLSPNVSGVTAIFASIAGGASGVTAVARDMGADEAIVLSIQYLRVLFILATVPLVAPLLGAGTGGAVRDQEVSWDGAWFTAIALFTGLVLARLLWFSASRLVLPLLAATGLSLAGLFPATEVPPAVLNFGYAIVGLMVGLSFTRRAVREIARLMPLALLQLVLGVAGCFLVGLVFADIAGVSKLDGYLATTPGGLPAVTAIAIGSGADVGLVIALQLVRLVLALLLLPVVGALIVRRPREADG
jgi:membrane AbrB-like protein